MATTATKQPAAKKSAPAKAPEKGYRDHLAGSRKGKVHELHDKQGAEAAWVLGKKLGLKEGTLRSWFAAWKRADAKPAPKAKKAAPSKPTAEKAAA
jgi:hypothetical protein